MWTSKIFPIRMCSGLSFSERTSEALMYAYQTFLYLVRYLVYENKFKQFPLSLSSVITA